MFTEVPYCRYSRYFKTSFVLLTPGHGYSIAECYRKNIYETGCVPIANSKIHENFIDVIPFKGSHL